VNLSSLRPNQQTDLVELSNVLRRHGTQRSALPASLPEPLLLSVARDLRAIESDEDDEEDQGWLAAPMMLVFSLMLGKRKSASSDKELTMSESTLFASLRIYQWAVEREIVTRITGKGGSEDEEALLKSLQEARQH
jgi:hypothetical protein